ncbi:MAG: hypothetical protein WD512_07440 [Candidatus Paceibacterota bacterium]
MTSAEDDGQVEEIPWMALTIFSRFLELTRKEIKDIVNQLQNSTIFRLLKSVPGNRSDTIKVKILSRRRCYETYREYWLTNDGRREFLRTFQF